MKTNLLATAAIALFDAWYLWESLKFDKGKHFLNSSGGFPTLLAALLLVLCLVQVIADFRKKQNKKPIAEAKPFTKKELIRGCFYILLMAGYCFVGLKSLGFIIATFLFVLIGISFYKEVKWYYTVITGVISVVAIYYLFTDYLYVTLPTGIFGI